MRKEYLSEDHHRLTKYPWYVGYKNFLIVQENFNIKPESLVLDIGCESGSFGIHIIPILKKGRYHGIEKNIVLAKAFMDYELQINKLTDKEPKILVSDELNFRRFKPLNSSHYISFDYIFDFCTGFYSEENLLELYKEVCKSLAAKGQFITNMKVNIELAESCGLKQIKSMNKIFETHTGAMETKEWNILIKKTLPKKKYSKPTVKRIPRWED